MDSTLPHLKDSRELLFGRLMDARDECPKQRNLSLSNLFRKGTATTGNIIFSATDSKSDSGPTW
jgi:hypothetical protein